MMHHDMTYRSVMISNVDMCDNRMHVMRLHCLTVLICAFYKAKMMYGYYAGHLITFLHTETDLSERSAVVKPDSSRLL